MSGPLRAVTFNPASVVITGGTIDNTVIGGTTPAAGTFTTLIASDIKTAPSNGSTVTISAWDGNFFNYKPFAVLTAADSPSLAISAPFGGTITINGATIGNSDPSNGTFLSLISTSYKLLGLTTGGTILASNVTGNGDTTLHLPDVNSTVAVLDLAQTYTKAQRGVFTTLTDASTVAVDMSLSNNFNLTLGGNRTLGVPTNMVAGQSGTISVRQDITGSRTLAYTWPYMFPLGSAPVLSTGKLVLDQLYYNINSYSTATVTVTIATPAVMTWTAHGLVSGQRIQLSTTGALPTGLAAATTYWVTVIDANTFNLSSSLANAQAATFIATSGSQSGVHTAVNASITISTNLGLA